MMDPLPVKMCVCVKRTFREIWDSGARDLVTAQRMFGCGQGCESCMQYLERMFETGETEFPLLPPRNMPEGY